MKLGVFFALLTIASVKGVSICDFNSARLNVTNAIVVEVIVNGTINAAVADADLVKFFNGVTPPGSVNFLANAGALGVLRDHLIQFFAQKVALDCTDGTIGAYVGRTDMADVHKDMPITLALFDKFNGAVASTAKSAGVPDDQLAQVGALLNSFKPQICNQADCGNGNGSGVVGFSLVTVVIALMFSKMF